MIATLYPSRYLDIEQVFRLFINDVVIGKYVRPEETEAEDQVERTALAESKSYRASIEQGQVTRLTCVWSRSRG